MNFVNNIQLYKEFRKRPVYRNFKRTTRLRRANLPRYLRILNLTWFPRKRYRRRKRQTNWAPWRFAPISWARLYISEVSFARFYQSIGLVTYTLLGADPQLITKNSDKLAGQAAVSSFQFTKRVISRLKPNRCNLEVRSVFLAVRGESFRVGLLAYDKQSLLEGGLASPWGLVYDDAVFSYNTTPLELYRAYPINLDVVFNTLLNYTLSIYKLVIIVTLLITN